MPTKVETDSVTGTETTGHEWDGIKELNTPLPRWWLIVFWITVIWSVAYFILYPSWPGWDGVWNYTARKDVAARLEAVQAERAEWLDKLAVASLDEIEQEPDLLEFAIAGGRAAFADNCAPCHGTGGAGGPGYPNLLDDDWLWGGTVEAIGTTLRHGIRWAQDEETRISDMPRFGVDELLTADQIGDVAEYVLSLSHGATDRTAADRGQTIYAENCAVCHGPNGGGNAELGAPQLNDAIWLYGGGKENLVTTISRSRRGVMPAWGGRLDPVTIKQLAIYVHSLGGGE
ncbi:MAG: cytochrome-c oxidase, cbb3-type subunit III [Rhodospirillales bacterium]|nr:MAG: cytochrome-c oxidase, cbb3-type subunit III [Rhodospirillales bacterium]